MSDADIVREALERLPWTRENVDAVDALDRLVALSRVHVTQATHDLLVAEGWLDPEQAEELRRERDLALENVRIREKFQIPMIPRGAQKRMERLEEALREYADPTAWGRVMTHAGRRETVFLVMNDPPWKIAQDALERVGGVRGGEEQRP